MALNGARKDPLSGFNFYVDVKSKMQGAFREVSGVGSESEVADYWDSDKDGKIGYYKVPGRMKWTNIVLKRGITDDMKAWDWRKEVEDGNVDKARADGSLVMMDHTGKEVARWNFFSAWPSKITGPSMNAGSNDVGIEEMEIVHERLVRIK